MAYLYTFLNGELKERTGDIDTNRGRFFVDRDWSKSAGSCGRGYIIVYSVEGEPYNGSLWFHERNKSQAAQIFLKRTEGQIDANRAELDRLERNRHFLQRLI